MSLEPYKVEISSTESQMLAKNLSTLIKTSKQSVQEIADELQISAVTIRRLTSGNLSNPTLSTLMLFADKFNISIDSLIKEIIEDSYLQNDSGKKKLFNKPVFVPILEWKTAEEINSIKELNLDEWKEWQPLPLEHGSEAVSEQSFALKSRPSMYPRYTSGTIFIIDPTVTASDGDTILIRIKSNRELTLRSLTIDPPDWELHSIVLDSKSMKYSQQEHQIIGVVMLTLLFNKKLIAQPKDLFER